MNKNVLILTIFVLFLSSSTSAYAEAFITVKQDGTVVKNVLGEETDDATTIVKSVAGTVISKVAEVVISKVDDKVQVALGGDDSSKTHIFEGSTKPIVEVEKDIPSKKLSVVKLESGFGIQEGGVTATTHYEVKIDPDAKSVTLTTATGERTLGVLPSDAMQTIVRANIVSSVPSDGTIEITENDTGELQYAIHGVKDVALFNVAEVKVPVVSYVSATNGQVTHIDEPKWLRIFGFLLE